MTETLTAKDFTLTEDGIAQNLAFVEFQKLEEVQPAAEVTERVAPFRVRSVREQ